MRGAARVERRRACGGACKTLLRVSSPAPPRLSLRASAVRAPPRFCRAPRSTSHRAALPRPCAPPPPAARPPLCVPRRFRPSKVKAICDAILAEEVGDSFVYTDAACKAKVKSLTGLIKSAVLAINPSTGLSSWIPRYKVVVQVTMGERKEQDVRVASRCLWDTETDNYASASMQNTTTWCSVVVFACYTE